MINPKVFCAYYRSPLGRLKIEGFGSSLLSVDFAPGKTRGKSSAISAKVRRQLDRYFRGQRGKFSLPLTPTGTIFQKRVWKALENIPYGKCVSYGEVAARLGCPKSVRAVARAIGQNKLPIIIPCHRVIGANGSLTGYAHGLRKKAWLLEHEAGL